MEFLFLILAVAGIVVAIQTTARIRRLEGRLENLSDRCDRMERIPDQMGQEPVAHSATAPAPSALVPTRPKTARVVGLDSSPPATRVGSITSEPSPPKPLITTTIVEADIPQRPLSARIEDLIGGKLPIWIGGLALVLAAFFLVRYSIEQGLLGPSVRSAIAAVFGLALIGASEAARRIERFASDPRVGQVLAGAGVASLYGTLYMAGQLYGIISPLVGFVMMVLVTGGALALSLRHGPPTAIMGLIGGFTAPFLSAPSGNLVPLLAYLGLLVAGLFAVAIHRGWTWLALAATGGSLVWSLGLMAADLTGIGPSLGLFIVFTALGATIMLPRTGPRDPRIRLLPMLAGFIQLAIFAPSIKFGLTGWFLYGLLSGAGLYLGRRDRKLMPASIAALGLVLILLFAGFDQGKSLTIWAAIGATFLFAVPGHAFARRPNTDRYWTFLAIGGGVGPALIACLAERSLLVDWQWGWLLFTGGLGTACLSWRARTEGRPSGTPDLALAGGGVVAAIMAFLAATLWFESDWFAVSALVVAAAISAWAKKVQDRFLFRSSAVAFGVGALCWTARMIANPHVIDSIFADAGVPSLPLLLSHLAGPAVLSGLMAWLHIDRVTDQPLRWTTLALLLGLLLALVPSNWHSAVLALATATALLSRSQNVLPRRGIEGLMAATGVSILAPALPFVGIFTTSLVGETLHYSNIPALWRVLQTIGLPAFAIALCLWFRPDRLADRVKIFAAFALCGALGATAYAVVKQPLAIGTDATFVTWGFFERALLTQALFAFGWVLHVYGRQWQKWAMIPVALALFRFIWFDLIVLNPLFVTQNVGAWPIANAAVIHFGLVTFWLWCAVRSNFSMALQKGVGISALVMVPVTVAIAVRQVFQGPMLDAAGVTTGENYSYSATFMALAVIGLWQGITRGLAPLRLAGLGLLTLVTIKVFLIDASALEGLLRILSFLGLGGALIGIGWGYGRMQRASAGEGRA